MVIFLALLIAALGVMPHKGPAPKPHLGFDRNSYPGDGNLRALRKVFSFSSYWLNAPPGQPESSWLGKRSLLQHQGFGFLVLFNGRKFEELSKGDPKALGESDGRGAAGKARSEGFPRGTIIFLDQEEGGRLLPQQREYIHAWIDQVSASGYRAGVYCSGIPAREQSSQSVTTATDIKENAGKRKISFWVSNDMCPPSPGCVLPNPPRPSSSGIEFADVWQFAQSPRRQQFAAACGKTYSADGNCYPPGLEAQHLHIDINSANSADPSQGRNGMR